MSDIAVPPPSNDDVVQAHIDNWWREAMRAAEEGRQAVRQIWPDVSTVMTETGQDHLRRALGDFEDAMRHLHLAGKHALGQAVYDEFLTDQVRRSVA